MKHFAEALLLFHNLCNVSQTDKDLLTVIIY